MRKSLPWSVRLANNSIPLANGCRLWMGAVNGDGYGVFTFTGDDGRRSSMGAHKAAWLAAGKFLGEGQVVMHATCHNPLCIAVEHLEAGSQLANIREREVTGTASRRSGPRPSPDERQRRLDALRSGMAAREFAERFGIGINAAHQWLRRWRSQQSDQCSTGTTSGPL